MSPIDSCLEVPLVLELRTQNSDLFERDPYKRWLFALSRQRLQANTERLGMNRTLMHTLRSYTPQAILS